MAIEHVIIPVDFSEASLVAVEQGRALARRAGADVELLSVTSPRDANTTAAALRSLAAADGNGTGLRVVTTDDDDIEGRLVDEVLERRNTLWCVGSHGRTAVGELMFGSVSADLVRDAEVPIVVIGPHSELRPTATVLAVALDGTDLSETILPAAVQVARTLGLTLRLMQVGLVHAESDAADSAYLARVASGLDHPERIDYDTLYGNADDALVDYLGRSGDVAMLALATRGVPSGARLSVPSTAMRVLRHAPVPMLMLHPPQPEPPAPSSAPVAGEAPLGDERLRVVVGIDTLRASLPAVQWAADEADRLGAVLQVLHTWQIPVSPAAMYGYPIWPDIEACREAALEEAAAAVAAVAAEHPDLIVETIVAEGGAVTSLAKQSRGAAMVVLGRHHHGRLASLLLSSTSESAVQRVDCPLVIIPCNTPDEVSAAT
jgi:nucleotide-binding universal stress UspA family protein